MAAGRPKSGRRVGEAARPEKGQPPAIFRSSAAMAWVGCAGSELSALGLEELFGEPVGDLEVKANSFADHWRFDHRGS